MRSLSLMLLLVFSAIPLGCVAEESDPVTTTESWDAIPATETQETFAETTPVFKVKLETSEGDVVLEVHPDWAPIGAAHFKELVEAGYYDDCRFFRVVDGFMAQVGMNGDPKVLGKWRDQTLKDEPVKQSNKPGMVTYAKTGAPNSRSVQFFINYGDNSFLDGQGFSPFAKVVEGMDVVNSFTKKYGEQPDQGMIASKGNEYLNAKFPDLTYIKKATIVAE